MVRRRSLLLQFAIIGSLSALSSPARADLHTWDGRHSIDRIAVTAVYFVPTDRTPLPDWRERVDYFCERAAAFHQREFAGASQMQIQVHPEPFVSERNTEQLRAGDGDFTFFNTLREVSDRLEHDRGDDGAFPILLVFSDINWRPLDDFYRLKPEADGFAFEGNYNDGRHFPGAASGGARATYIADRGVGWGLVSADGWRVPYTGSDCVVYHEGLGHTVGLPHPEPGNNSVMSLGQYHGWLSESWLDDDQKQRLGWQADPAAPIARDDLFSKFRAIPDPVIPAPGQPATLQCDWPRDVKLQSLRVRVQTDVFGPWIDLPQPDSTQPPAALTLGSFDRPTPVSYRIDASTADGESVELWGYFQVRSSSDALPLPAAEQASPGAHVDRIPLAADASEANLLEVIDPNRDAVAGEWSLAEGVLTSPKRYGARIEVPGKLPEAYRLIAVVEPQDEPNAFLLGVRMANRRFVVMFNFQDGETPASALEDVDGKNFAGNPTTVRRRIFEKGRPSQIVCDVRRGSVLVHVDGRKIFDWTGDPASLGLSEYWKTPNDALFIGAYDCRYRISRLGLIDLTADH